MRNVGWMTALIIVGCLGVTTPLAQAASSSQTVGIVIDIPESAQNDPQVPGFKEAAAPDEPAVGRDEFGPVQVTQIQDGDRRVFQYTRIAEP